MSLVLREALKHHFTLHQQLSGNVLLTCKLGNIPGDQMASLGSAGLDGAAALGPRRGEGREG